jgi:hypothetical protein
MKPGQVDVLEAVRGVGAVATLDVAMARCSTPLTHVLLEWPGTFRSNRRHAVYEEYRSTILSIVAAVPSAQRLASKRRLDDDCPIVVVQTLDARIVVKFGDAHVERPATSHACPLERAGNRSTGGCSWNDQWRNVAAVVGGLKRLSREGDRR